MTPSERITLIDQSFSAKSVPPVALPLTYRLGLLLLCGLMILLPLLYLGLIALVGYGLFYHIINDAIVFESVSSGKAAFVIFVAPIIIGVILLFFMIKPLFAPKAKQATPIKLDPGQEPILEAFVNNICDAVKAPKPRSIALDGQVNASASFEPGIIAFFLGRLRLTVGLPLLAGMPVHSIGGILAHEFGHFAQGGGMRLTYIIRMINHWFARVVYGRDSWDESIERNSQDSDFRIMILLNIARGFIFAVRKILWALMQVGHIASCYMSRQMEFDADSYETRFAGSQVFAQTSERLTKLGYASQLALSQLREHYETQKLSDDLPSFIEHCRSSFTSEQLASIDKAQTEQKTGILDTHPCDADRIAAANKLASTGIFHHAEPATLLLVDYPTTARQVTQHHYSEILGVDTRKIKLLDNDQIQAAAARKRAELEAANTFLHGACTIELPITLTELPPLSPTTTLPPQTLAPALAKLANHAFNATEFHEVADAAYKLNTNRYYNQFPGKYGELSQDASDAFSQTAAVHAQQLQGEPRDRFIARYELFRQTCELVPDWFKIRDIYVILQTKLSRWQNSETTADEINSAINQYANPINDCFRTLAAKIDKKTPLPFADEDSDLTAIDYLYDNQISTGHPITDAYHRAAHYLDKFHTYYHRLLGQLALELAPTTTQTINTPEPQTTNS